MQTRNMTGAQDAAILRNRWSAPAAAQIARHPADSNPLNRLSVPGVPSLAASLSVLLSTHGSALAQPNNPLLIADPTPLPRAPWWEVIVLQQPIFAAGALILAGVLLFVRMNQLGRAKRGGLLLAACALAAAAVYAIGSLIETPRERMVRQTEALIGAVRRGDAAALDAILDDSCQLQMFLYPEGVGKPEIIARVGRSFADGGEYQLKEAAVLEMQSSRDGPSSGRTQFKIRVTSRDGFLNLSWWRLSFRLGPSDQWRVVRIEPVVIGGMN